MKKPDMACTTIRQTPLNVPDTGAHIRQGLSNMFDTPTIPEGGTCSPLSGTTGCRLVPSILKMLCAGSSPMPAWTSGRI
jgi:hypothetical protein